jgi:hypothetical protein
MSSAFLAGDPEPEVDRYVSNTATMHIQQPDPSQVLTDRTLQRLRFLYNDRIFEPVEVLFPWSSDPQYFYLPKITVFQLLRIVREVHPSTSNVVRSTEPVRSHQCIFELRSLQFTSEPEEPTSSTESSSHFSDDSYIDDQFFSEFMFRLLQQYPGQRIHPVEIIFPWTENPKQVRLPHVSVQEMLNLVIEVCPTTRRSIPGLSPGDLLRPIIDHSLYRFRNTGPVGGTD